MYYLIDGYNVFFKTQSDKAFIQEREAFLDFMCSRMEQLNLYGALILDYAHDLATSYPTRLSSKHLECIYAPSGLDADNYILEFLFHKSDRRQITVVTSDVQLSRSIKELDVQVLSSEAFLHKLSTKPQEISKPKMQKESSKRIQYLLRVFTEKLEKKQSE